MGNCTYRCKVAIAPYSQADFLCTCTRVVHYASKFLDEEFKLRSVAFALFCRYDELLRYLFDIKFRFTRPDKLSSMWIPYKLVLALAITTSINIMVAAYFKLYQNFLFDQHYQTWTIHNLIYCKRTYLKLFVNILLFSRDQKPAGSCILQVPKT